MEAKFLELVKETLEIEDRDIQLSDQFKGYPEWDSLANLTMVAMLDDEFNVVIDNQKFKNMNTLQELLDEVKSLS
ncbi:acyl carrier protein [Kaistella sp.]|uniref:acyl carrier protein n=1 Tax=Kaistella sp. TaxID=2782235 RepID=UPI003C3D599E